MILLLILSMPSSAPSPGCPLYPAGFSRTDFPYCPIFGPCQVVRVLSNAQSALIHVYMPDMASTRYFLSIVVVHRQCSLEGTAPGQSRLGTYCTPALPRSIAVRRGPFATKLGTTVRPIYSHRFLSRPFQSTEHRN